jgi:RNA polymerase sigma-70 factor (ECF subfamily)
MPKPLSTAFREALVLPPSDSSSELDVALAAYVEAARAPWPEFGLEPADFVRYLAERAPAGQLPPIRHAADLWLAWACVQGAPAAVTCFLRDYETLVMRVVRRRGGADDLAADVRQMLAEKILVGDARTGRRAKLADYKGQGALRGWVATAAATTLASERRNEGRRRSGAESLADKGFLVRLDPELQYLKQRYAVQVHDAIVAALDASSTRDKALLRLHLKERLSIDALGAMYGVNRATAARWLAAARRTVRARTIERLRACLELNPRECESLLGLVNSQLEVSMLNHLEPDPLEPDPLEPNVEPEAEKSGG